MYINFEIKSILKDLKDNLKTDAEQRAVEKLDKFCKKYTDFDIQPKLMEVGAEFAQRANLLLEQFRSGKSWNQQN